MGGERGERDSDRDKQTDGDRKRQKDSMHIYSCTYSNKSIVIKTHICGKILKKKNNYFLFAPTNKTKTCAVIILRGNFIFKTSLLLTIRGD